jgi:Lrp/AsnC family transcriptional regulator for asnA, asnC and gidA
MNRVDMKIVGLLMQDAQMPFSEIAKSIDVGVDTVIRRYANLKKEGVIHSASVIVDLKKCGYEGHAFILVNTLAGAESKKIFEEFIKITNVLTVVHTIGDYDLLLHCIYADTDDLADLERNITKVEGIQYLSILCISATDFIQTFPAIDYYSKAVTNDPTKP